MPITFRVNKADFEIIGEIAERAVRTARRMDVDYPLHDARMDVTACHANGCSLRLAELLDADDFNFAHDVFGIRRHLNRETGELEGGFWPRFARPQPRLASAE